MTLKEILEDNQSNKIFEDCVGKSFHKYKIFRYMDKEEFYQECCIYTMERIHKYNSNGCSLKSYLYKIMTWCAMQQYNNAHGHSETISKVNIENTSLRLDDIAKDGVGGESYGSYIEDYKVNIEEQVLNRITVEEIPKSDVLTEKQKIVVQHLIEGKSNSYIAKELNCSESNIRNLILKIRKNLLQNYSLS